jgi:hypothetical protein
MLPLMLLKLMKREAFRLFHPFTISSAVKRLMWSMELMRRLLRLPLPNTQNEIVKMEKDTVPGTSVLCVEVSLS